MSSEPKTPPPDEDPNEQQGQPTSPPPPPFKPDPRLIGYLEREQKRASRP